MSDFSWLDDFNEYSRRLLKIKSKSGQLVPFAMNEAQNYVHERLEAQRRERGFIRAVILKGRQQGISTYIEGRFFHRTATNFGIQALILTHEQQATDNLFGMTQRFLENYPAEMRPALGAANSKELVFSGLDSSFRVATAGNRGAGRSATAQLLHGSEMAYWPSADEHLAGIMQTIPMLPETEILFESTGNGIGNTYHDVWQQGESGKGNWQSIFIPWFWQREYRCDGVDLDAEDREYGAIYELDHQQMQWRRQKIRELGGDLRLFMREYPSSSAEAFSVSSEKSFISSFSVQAARKSSAPLDGSAPKIIGVDPARFGGDSTSIFIRCGRVSERIKKINGLDTMEVVGEIIQAIKKYHPDAVFIDVGGIGSGIYDRLKELNYKECHSINFGSSPLDKSKYSNKRAEMWGLMKNWLMSQPAQIPDDDKIEVDLCGLHYTYDSSGKLKLESKDDAKKRGIKSPDDGDALALTFAMPVKKRESVVRASVNPYRPTVSGMGM